MFFHYSVSIDIGTVYQVEVLFMFPMCSSLSEGFPIQLISSSVDNHAVGQSSCKMVYM